MRRKRVVTITETNENALTTRINNFLKKLYEERKEVEDIKLSTCIDNSYSLRYYTALIVYSEEEEEE